MEVLDHLQDQTVRKKNIMKIDNNWKETKVHKLTIQMKRHDERVGFNYFFISASILLPIQVSKVINLFFALRLLPKFRQVIEAIKPDKMR